MEIERGFCLWLTGLPSAGKTTIAREVESRLRRHGVQTELLDGDEVRRGLSSDLGFDRKSREMHASRVTFVAKVLARNRVVALVALISPYRRSRAEARHEIGAFVEVYVSTPLALCEERDVKGLYQKARRGEIHEMTGIDDPYEPPENPEIVVDTQSQGPSASAEYVLTELVRLGWLPADFASSDSPRRPRDASSTGPAASRST
jgi:adenylylsulfate kinase